MAQEFNRKTLTLVVAQICQTIGWHSINSTPLELLVDLLHRYLFEVGKNAHLYAEQLGHTNPDLDDLGLAFQEMGINVQDLQEYVQYVDSVPFIHQVPKFPIPRESHLNFLKPGSREVVTRPVYVHEYLPPMHPELENEVAEDYPNKNSPLSVDISSPGPSSGPNSASGSLSPQSSPKLNSLNPFKRPGEPVSAESPALKRARLIMEEEARPLREISSVMMTTSGYLSPAREGKLPESRTPLQPSDSRSNSPQPISHYPSVPPEVNKPEKKIKKLLPKKSSDNTKKMDKENKKKEGKEIDPLGDATVDDSNVAKLVSMKETSKLKAFKPGGFKHQSQSGASSSIGGYKIPKVSKKTSPKRSKLPPVHVPQSPPSPSISDPDDKISSAPDRQKLSFFKKISKVKEEKLDRSDKLSEDPVVKEEQGFSSGGWVINEERARKDAKEARSSQIDSCIESVIQQGIHDSEITRRDRDKDVSVSSDSFVDVGGSNLHLDHSPHDMYPIESDVSPPHTPTAPKTPEIVHTLLAKEESKKKKKDKSKLKNEMKSKSRELSPKKLKMEVTDDEFSERPKTPKLDVYVHVPPHPGLIPPLLTRKPEDQRLENPALLTDSPPRRSMSPEKPVTPGTGIDGSSPFLLHTPSSMLPYFHPSPTSSASTPTGVPPTPGSNISSISSFIKKKSPDGQIKGLKKEHDPNKKDKKDKNRIKKKKDKKDKNKDKSLKKKDKILKKVKDKELKNADKSKEKVKEKKKEKKKKDKKKKEEGNSQPPSQPQLLVTEEKGVPKLTLRLGSDSPCPPTPDVVSAPTAPKLVIKTVKKPVTTEEERMLKAKIQPQPPLFSSCHVIESESYRREKEREREREQREREREKEEKEREREQEERRQIEYEAEREREKERARLAALEQASRVPVSSSRPSKTKSSKNSKQLFSDLSSFTSIPSPTPSPSPSVSHLDTPKVKKSSSKKEKSAKKLDLPISSAPVATSVPTMLTTPVTVGEPAAALTPEQITSGFFFDAQGNKVWICPACKGPDDGRPMIGCDDCDAWYHWVCVNITIAPDDHENWYCQFCTMKKSESSEKKKKKKSKKKPKVPV